MEHPSKHPQDKSSEKNTSPSAVWGERDERDKGKSDIAVKEASDEKSHNRSNAPMEREIILSDKARQLQNQHRDDPRERENKSDKRSQEKELRDRNNDYEKGPGRGERYSSSSNQEVESRLDRERGEKQGSWGNSRPNERPRPPRWGSNDHRHDNRTPERDSNVSSGRSTENSMKSVEGDLPHRERDRGHEIEKSRSSEMIKDNSPVESIDKGHREEYGKPKDFERSGSFEKRNKNINEDDSDSRGKGLRNKERIGHAVYQPRLVNLPTYHEFVVTVQ